MIRPRQRTIALGAAVLGAAVLAAASLGKAGSSGISGQSEPAGGRSAVLASPRLAGDGRTGSAGVAVGAWRQERGHQERDVEGEVEAAYLRSWDLYARSVRELDSSGLEGVYADDALVVVLREVDRRRAEGRPVRVDVEHSYRVQLLGVGRAVVFDAYLNHSVALDDASGRPVQEDPSEVLNESFTFRLRDGAWMLTSTARVEDR
ncbi:MAG: hypothetical protein ACRDV9_15225 [Acidimicrobiia bacterium]